MNLSTQPTHTYLQPHKPHKQNQNPTSHHPQTSSQPTKQSRQAPRQTASQPDRDVPCRPHTHSGRGRGKKKKKKKKKKKTIDVGKSHHEFPFLADNNIKDMPRRRYAYNHPSIDSIYPLQAADRQASRSRTPTQRQETRTHPHDVQRGGWQAGVLG